MMKVANSQFLHYKKLFDNSYIYECCGYFYIASKIGDTRYETSGTFFSLEGVQHRLHKLPKLSWVQDFAATTSRQEQNIIIPSIKETYPEIQI